jgi:hypothetical protein
MNEIEPRRCVAPMPMLDDTLLVLGRSTSAVEDVRNASADWTLVRWAPPRLREIIEGTDQTGDTWLVAVQDTPGIAGELDRDPTVIGYAAAWRPSPSLCGAVATEERVVEGVVCHLCAEHAAELDAQRTED